MLDLYGVDIHTVMVSWNWHYHSIKLKNAVNQNMYNIKWYIFDLAKSFNEFLGLLKFNKTTE